MSVKTKERSLKNTGFPSNANNGKLKGSHERQKTPPSFFCILSYFQIITDLFRKCWHRFADHFFSIELLLLSFLVGFTILPLVGNNHSFSVQDNTTTFKTNKIFAIITSHFKNQMKRKDAYVCHTICTAWHSAKRNKK